MQVVYTGCQKAFIGSTTWQDGHIYNVHSNMHFRGVCVCVCGHMSSDGYIYIYTHVYMEYFVRP